MNQNKTLFLRRLKLFSGIFIFTLILGLLFVSKKNQLRAVGRDAEKKAALKSIQHAIMDYYETKHHFPTSGDKNQPICGTDPLFLQPILESGFLDNIPIRPDILNSICYQSLPKHPEVGAIVYSELELLTEGRLLPESCRPLGEGEVCRADQIDSYFCLCLDR